MKPTPYHLGIRYDSSAYQKWISTRAAWAAATANPARNLAAAMARIHALLALLVARVASLKPTTRRRIINGLTTAVVGALPMAAVAQEKGLGFGEAIGKELGIVDGCVEINRCVGCTIIH